MFELIENVSKLGASLVPFGLCFSSLFGHAFHVQPATPSSARCGHLMCSVGRGRDAGVLTVSSARRARRAEWSGASQVNQEAVGRGSPGREGPGNQLSQEERQRSQPARTAMGSSRPEGEPTSRGSG